MTDIESNSEYTEDFGETDKLEDENDFDENKLEEFAVFKEISFTEEAIFANQEQENVIAAEDHDTISYNLHSPLIRKHSLQAIVRGSAASVKTLEEDSFQSFDFRSDQYPSDHLSELYVAGAPTPSASYVYNDSTLPHSESKESLRKDDAKSSSELINIESLKEADEEKQKPQELHIPFIDPFKCYCTTSSIENLLHAAKQGVIKKHIPTLTLEDVILHNKENDCWVVIHGVVRDLTYLIQEHKEKGEYHLVKPIVANAGKDISFWFNKQTKDILHFVHPITGVYVPYTPHGRLPDVGLQVPSSEWMIPTKVPWWQDSKNVVAVMTKQSRPIRILNMLCGVEIKMNVCCEDTIRSIQTKYMDRFNWHATSYTWKFDRKVLDMNLTLDENGIKDDSKMLASLGVSESIYTPCLMIYFNDDLTTT